MVLQLHAEGNPSPHVAKLYEKLRHGASEAAHKSIEQEIRQEMASSLGRAEEKLLVAMIEVDLASHQGDVAAFNSAVMASLIAFSLRIFASKSALRVETKSMSFVWKSLTLSTATSSRKLFCMDFKFGNEGCPTCPHITGKRKL